MEIFKDLSFQVKDGKEMRAPRWVECEAHNTRCPVCTKEMVVILGKGKLLYAFCPHCRKYFLAE